LPQVSRLSLGYARSADFDSLKQAVACEGIPLFVETHVRDPNGLAVIRKHGRFLDDHGAVFLGYPFDRVGGRKAIRNRIGK
jgi:hypothetical protein